MAKAFDREGTFNAKPIAWGVRTSEKTQSVGITIDWIPYELMDKESGGFSPFENPDGLTVSGDIWIVKKNGDYNKLAIQRTMVDALGWSGEFDDFLEDGKFNPPKCQISVELNEYKGKVSYKVAWVNPLGGGDYTPAKAGAEVISELSEKFGNNMKQIINSEEPTPF